MDKTMAGLLGAVGALVAGSQAQAAPPHAVLEAASYADLLRPVPNALETLKALDEAQMQQAQYYPYYYQPPPPPRYWYHHHHHHHRYYQRYYEHHHHHHHHRGYYERW